MAKPSLNTTPWSCATWGSPSAYPIVLIHGFMQNGSAWEQVAAALAGRFYVCAPTIEAESPHEASLEALAARTQATVQLALSLAGHATCALIGYSMGGRIALACARMFPDLIAALVLESAGLGPANDEERRQLAERNTQMAQRLQQHGLAAFVSWWEGLPLFETQRNLPATTQQAVRAMRLSCNPDKLAWLLEHAGAHTMPPASEATGTLAQAPFPSLYLAGTLDAKYAALAPSLPRNVRTCLLDAGHNVHLEQPLAYTQSVLAFLDGALEGRRT